MIRIRIEKLDDYLRFRNWTDSDLARALRVSPSVVCRLRKGAAPSRRVMERLIALTGVGMEEIFEVQRDHVPA